jgi:hypothetical protein
MLGNIIPILWVVENLAIENKNMAILWGKNYGVVELWVHVKRPIIHKEWRGKVEGFMSYLGNGHVQKPTIYLENHLAKSAWPIGKFSWTLWKSTWISSRSVLCQVWFILLTSPPNCEFGELVGWAPILRRHLTKHNGQHNTQED